MIPIYYKSSEGEKVFFTDYTESHSIVNENKEAIDTSGFDTLILDDIVGLPSMPSMVRVGQSTSPLYYNNVDGFNRDKPIAINVSEINSTTFDIPVMGKVWKYRLSKKAKYRMLTETDLLNNQWEHTTVGNNFPKIAHLTKPIVSPKFKVRIAGQTEQEMLENLEEIISIFDRDCFLEQKGRLYIGDYYRECYIIANTKGKVFRKNATVVEFQAVTDTMWMKETDYHFTGISQDIPEISATLFPSASHRAESIVYSKNPNGTTTIDWDPQTYPQFDWFMVDFGESTTVDTISGMKIVKTNVSESCHPILEYNNGETEINSSSISAEIETQTSLIDVRSINEVRVTSYSGTSPIRNGSITLFGYASGQEETAYTLEQNRWFNVENFDYIKFLIGGGPLQTVTINYQTSGYEWTELQDAGDLPVGTFEFNEVSEITLRRLRVSSSTRVGHISTEEFSVELPLIDVYDNMFDWRHTYDASKVTAVGCDYSHTSHIDLSINPSPANTVGYVYLDFVQDVKIKELSAYYTSVAGQAEGGSLWVEVLAPANSSWEEDSWVQYSDISTDTESGERGPSWDKYWKRVRLAFYVDDLHASPCGAFDLHLEIYVERENTLVNESYAPSEAIISIQGANYHPQLLIGETEYGADFEIPENHTVEINTENKTVMDVDDEGNGNNIFDKRIASTFDRIERGEQQVSWVGRANIDVTVKQQRSEPKWN